MQSPVRLDIVLLFGTRIVRLFAYGFLSVVLVLYLAATGLPTGQVGMLLTITLLGDAAISLWLTTHADRMGRKRTQIIGATLMLGQRDRSLSFRGAGGAQPVRARQALRKPLPPSISLSSIHKEELWNVNELSN